MIIKTLTNNEDKNLLLHEIANLDKEKKYLCVIKEVDGNINHNKDIVFINKLDLPHAS